MHVFVLYKKGEKKFGVLYMHVYFISMFYTKRGRRILRIYMHICFVYAKRGEEFLEFMHVYLLVNAYMFV